MTGGRSIAFSTRLNQIHYKLWTFHYVICTTIFWEEVQFTISYMKSDK